MDDNNVASALETAFDLLGWIANAANNIQIPDVQRVSGGVFQYSLDIGDGILIMLRERLPAVAFALARVHFEACVCGIWLYRVADENAKERYLEGKYPKLETLVKKVFDSSPKTYQWVKQNKELNLKSFQGLAHSGVEHFHRRNNEFVIEPRYVNRECFNLIKQTVQVQVYVAIHLFMLNDNVEKMDALITKANDSGLVAR